MGDNAQFMAAIDAFVAKANGNTALVVKGLGIRILARLVRMSPVDTGRFRGNWQVAFDAPPAALLERFDKQGNETLKNGSLVLEQFKVGTRDVYFTNNLPYAWELEFGSSQQAPNGMIRVTAEELVAYLKQATEELRL
ncbi:HK97 gp10 family phage protein [Salmonella enterica]